LGFVARVASWSGGLGGFVLALRLLPVALRRADHLTSIARLLLSLGVLLLGAALGGAFGEYVGSRLRRAVPPGPARLADHVGGAVVGLLGALVGVWLFLPMMADVPGAAARLARNSVIVSTLQKATPRPPDMAQAVRSLVGDTRFPDVFADLRPAPDTGPPPAAVPVPAAIVDRAAQSTVNVESFGCGGLHEGSGFTVAEDTVVTNAHVVAGGERIRVRLPDGRLLPARIVVFDDNRDLAVLEVSRLRQQPLPIASSRVGTEGAVLGYPGGQNTVRVAPAVVRDETLALGTDIYREDRTRRRVLFLAASLRPGDSGAAFIDKAGRVVGVAFAIAPDRQDTAYALADSELRAVLTQPRSRNAGGPCV
jgi:S1-C subfamily serine protease